MGIEPWWSGEGAPGRGALDPLAEASAHLNFQHSLLSERHAMHQRTVDVFLDVAATRERTAAAWERCAQLAIGGPTADRYRALAEQGRHHLATTLDRTKALMANRRDAPRPVVHDDA
jgi:hypothetical protein